MKRLNRLRLVVHLIALIAVTGGAGVRIVNAQVEDTAAPALTEFDFNPKTIDVSAGPQTVTVTVRITDDLSGFEFGNFIFLSPSGQQVSSAGYNAQNRVSGNSLDGVYQASTAIPQFSEAGTWRVIQVFLRDQVGNSVVLSQWTDNNGDNQRWSFIATGGGYYKVGSKVSGKYLDVVGASAADGARIHQYQDNGADNQRWMLEMVAPAAIALRRSGDDLRSTTATVVPWDLPLQAYFASTSLTVR